MMTMCSLLCSTDVIAAVSLISPKEQPKLFSLVFGEGIVNDAVSIILFNTVVRYSSESEGGDFSFEDSFVIIADFGTLGFNSILCGILFALACSYLLKRMRSLTKSPVSESAMIFSFGYISYIFAELSGLSGIITLLTSGIFMANYAWFNLSPQGKQSSVIIFQFLGFMTEGFVFSYLGLTFYAYKEFMWSWELICVEMVIILIGRSLGTLGMIGLLKLCGYEKDHPKPLTLKELLFITYAGLIRGAIAFGLVLRISPSFPDREVIVTTCLTLVVFTTVFFGSTVGLLGKLLFPPEKHTPIQDPIVADVDGDDSGSYEVSLKSDELSEKETSSDSDTDREELLHYNVE